MKKIISAAATLLMALSLAACQSAAPAPEAGPTAPAAQPAAAEPATEAAAEAVVEGDVMLYTSGNDAFMAELVAMFNEKYPDANAQYFRSGTEEVISKLMAEKMTNSVQADVIMVSDAPTFEGLKAGDMLQSYAPCWTAFTPGSSIRSTITTEPSPASWESSTTQT